MMKIISPKILTELCVLSLLNMKTWFWYAICLHVWMCTPQAPEPYIGFTHIMNILTPETGKSPLDGPYNTKHKFSCKQLQMIMITFK
jgi:hypothetical protein